MTSQPHDTTWRRPGESGEPLPARPASARLVDPEDDLTPVGYPGEFGSTSVIPYQDPSHAGSGYHLLDQPRHSTGRHGATEHSGTDADDDSYTRGRRGTQHLGLLILRAGLGVVLGAHALQKLFGWWGGSGLGGLKNSLSDVGYHHADVLAYISAGGELAAAVLLVLGLFTPIAAGGALAFLINGLLAAISVKPHQHNFAYFLPDGQEYQISLIVMAVAVILAGPGRYGLDAGRGWAHRPFIGSFVTLVVGVAAGIAVWVFLKGGNPVS